MNDSIGSVFGNIRQATILKKYNDGTVLIGLDEIGNSPQQFKAFLPSSWTGPEGQFIGGSPPRGATVSVAQGQGGRWYVINYLPSRSAVNDGVFSSLKDGQAVMQVSGGTRLTVDPKLGIEAGDNNQSFIADPKRQIFSHNFSSEMSFTQARRQIDGIIKRDIKENSNRSLFGTLRSHLYNDALTTIGMDPTTLSSINTLGEAVRNLPLVENRQIIYEFAPEFYPGNDSEELEKINKTSITVSQDLGKRASRTDTLSLTQDYPNFLIETIQGTVVDIFGNILDLNRNILPIGKIEKLSLVKNTDKGEAYKRIKAEHRKAMAFHFEINTKKSGQMDDAGVEDLFVNKVDDVTNYSRNRSRFFIDIDKEGQFKINVPQSSETGNVPLLTRYENYSSLVANITGPTEASNTNSFLRNEENIDVFLDNFAGKPVIGLKSSDSVLDGYEAPIDRITAEPIKLGTAFHDISKACFSFLPGSTKIHLYESNTITDIEPYDKIVEDTLITSGKDANAGGRSGTISLDGFLSLNIGANTSDRQSLWLDCAGGVVTQIGKDKRGISQIMHLDGDMIVQLGGVGIGNTYDTRFQDQNDAIKMAALDIRVMSSNADRPMTILRIDGYGVRIATEGVLNFTGQQGIVMSTQGTMHLNAENIMMFSNAPGVTRIVERNGVPF